MDDLRILTGNANPELAQAIADELGTALCPMVLSHFADGETQVMIEQSVRGADVFVVQPTCPPTNQNLMELLVILDALKRASAGRTTAVIPYYGYARQEKKVRPREPITGKLVADLLTIAGMDRLLVIDLHVQSIQGFFDLPVDHLPAGPILAQYMLDMGFSEDETVVVAPDVGGVGRASEFADRLNASLAICAKRRPEPNRAQIIEVIGDLEGRRAVVVDDMIDTGGSVISAAEAAIGLGAREVYVCATHAVFSGDAADRLERSPVQQVVVTDTIPFPPDKCRPKIRMLSVAPILAEAIRRVHADASVSTLFER